eukprot:5503362-Amphidinium_carterae.1
MSGEGEGYIRTHMERDNQIEITIVFVGMVSRCGASWFSCGRWSLQNVFCGRQAHWRNGWWTATAAWDSSYRQPFPPPKSLQIDYSSGQK